MIKKKVVTFDRKTGEVISEKIVGDAPEKNEATFYDPMCKAVAESFVRKHYPEIHINDW